MSFTSEESHWCCACGHMRSVYENLLLVCIKQRLLGRTGQNSSLNKIFRSGGYKISAKTTKTGKFLWVSSLDFFFLLLSMTHEGLNRADHLFPHHVPSLSPALWHLKCSDSSSICCFASSRYAGRKPAQQTSARFPAGLVS